MGVNAYFTTQGLLRVYFARSASESGTIGMSVGPPLQTALSSALGSKSLGFIGITYAANILGFLEGGDPACKIDSWVIHCCFDTKLVVLGSAWKARGEKDAPSHRN